MAAVIAFVSIVSIAKDIIDIANSIRTLYKDVKSIEQEIGFFIEQIKVVQDVACVFEKSFNNEDDNEDTKAREYICRCLCYLKALLEKYRSDLVEVETKMWNKLTFVSGHRKNNMEKSKIEIMRITCTLSSYTLVELLKKTENLESSAKTIVNNTSNIQEKIDNLTKITGDNKNFIKKMLLYEYDTVLDNLTAINLKNYYENMKFEDFLEENSVLCNEKDIIEEKEYKSVHIARHDSTDVIVHCVEREGRHDNDIYSVAVFLYKNTHKNILNLKNIAKCDTRFIMISCFDTSSMECLEHAVRTKTRMSNDDIMNILIGVAKGLSSIHTSGFVHKSLNSRNVILARKEHLFEPKITGFNLSREIGSQSGNSKNTDDILEKLWLPAERVKGGEYTTSCDVYSFGVLMVEMCLATPIIDYEELVNETNVDNIITIILRLLETSCRDNNYIDMIKNCTCKNPRLRLRTGKDILRKLKDYKEIPTTTPIRSSQD
jgi:hypothetical protein